MFRAAGRSLFWAGLALAAPAHAQPSPTAEYHANLLDGHPGDIFEVVITVRWPGIADAFDVPAPRPAEVDGLACTLVDTESSHDTRGSLVRFRWQVAATAPDTYALPRILPVVAYPRESPTPIAIQPLLPLEVTIRPRLSTGKRIAIIAAAGLGAGGIAVGALALGRRRADRHAAGDADAARRLEQAAHEARLADAVAHRVAGDHSAYLETLVALARDAGAPAAARTELAALHERIAFAGHRPAEHELERAAAIVRRLLTARPPSEDAPRT